MAVMWVLFIFIIRLVTYYTSLHSVLLRTSPIETSKTPGLMPSYSLTYLQTVLSSIFRIAPSELVHRSLSLQRTNLKPSSIRNTRNKTIRSLLLLRNHKSQRPQLSTPIPARNPIRLRTRNGHLPLSTRPPRSSSHNRKRQIPHLRPSTPKRLVSPHDPILRNATSRSLSRQGFGNKYISLDHADRSPRRTRHIGPSRRTISSSNAASQMA